MLRICLTAKLLSKTVDHFTFLPATYESSSFSTALPALSLVSLCFNRSNKYVVMFHCGLICFSLVTKDAEHLFHVLICHLCSFFGEVSAQIFSLFPNWDIYFLIAEFGEFCICFGYIFFVRYVICRNFPH